MSEKPVALWAVPRSISTAFERIFVEREDFEVFHEPFSVSYYYSDERRSNRYADEEPKEEYRFENVLTTLTADHDRPVFFKDMAYHVAGYIDEEFAANFRNSFLIRDPKQMLVSFHKMWPDFTFEEAGYERLHELFGRAEEAGQEPVVVEATDLAANTEGTVATYCEKLGIPFKSEALSWEPRKVPEWRMWDGWHTDAQESTGIEEIPQKEVSLPKELEGTYERCLPYYEALREKRIQPAGLSER